MLVTVALGLLVVAPAEVKAVGRLRDVMRNGQVAGKVSLRDVTRTPHVYGVGPIAGLKGEITVVDGKVWTSRIEGGRERVTADPAVAAPFLVYSSVPKWSEHRVAGPLDEAKLEAWLAGRKPKQGRTPFLVRGIAEKVDYHIVNLPTGTRPTHETHDKFQVHRTIGKGKEVVLVGFFTSREEDMGVFVHMGARMHVHALTADGKQMGHVEGLKLGSATLFLPG